MTTQTGNVESASQDAASKFNHSVTEKQTRQAAIEIYGTRREVALIWRQGIGLQGLNVQVIPSPPTHGEKFTCRSGRSFQVDFSIESFTQPDLRQNKCAQVHDPYRKSCR
ncbi:hypothetical protein Bbelb_324980 [Branchiostoma belcheri]|nr:hypothetical protein Bbelb_324980 [Branchiostoma belcheri]